jgi:hypothetical protein
MKRSSEERGSLKMGRYEVEVLVNTNPREAFV